MAWREVIGTFIMVGFYGSNVMVEKLHCSNCSEFQTFWKRSNIENPKTEELVIWEICHRCQKPITERRITQEKE